MVNPWIYNKSLEDIEGYIQSNLTINQTKKVETGEVFTPFHLIQDMLDILPKTIWKQPDYKWLDPGCGMGNFSMLVFYYLDKGLSSWETNVAKRREHILKNMLYMIELSPLNVEKVNYIFGEKCNIYKGDALQTNIWMDKFKQNDFHVIMGNPPYNTNGMRGKGRKDQGISTLWPKFVDLSLKVMKRNGFCLLFTPNSWTELKSPLSKRIMEHQIVYLRNFDCPSAYKIFDKKAGSMPLCYYLIKNTKPTKSTKVYDSVMDEYVDFYIHKHKFIPNKNISLVSKVLSKATKNIASYYHFTPPKVKKDTSKFFNTFAKSHPYPLINYVHKRIYITYSTLPSIMQNGRPKLVFPNYSMGYPILDKDGILDVGGRASYVLFVEDDSIKRLRKIQEFFVTNLALTLINSLKTAQKFLSTRTFDLFPDVTQWDMNKINDEVLSTYYDLSKDELNMIERQIKEGEGNLSETRRKEIISFSLSDFVSNETIEYIKKKVKEQPTINTTHRRGRNKKNQTRKKKLQE